MLFCDAVFYLDCENVKTSTATLSFAKLDFGDMSLFYHYSGLRFSNPAFVLGFWVFGSLGLTQLTKTSSSGPKICFAVMARTGCTLFYNKWPVVAEMEQEKGAFEYVSCFSVQWRFSRECAMQKGGYPSDADRRRLETGFGIEVLYGFGKNQTKERISSFCNLAI